MLSMKDKVLSWNGPLIKFFDQFDMPFGYGEFDSNPDSALAFPLSLQPRPDPLTILLSLPF